MPFKILFVSHEATRTGAPIVFLHLLRWLKANTNIEITILLKNGGILSDDFFAVAPTFYWNLPIKKHDFLHRISEKIWGHLFNYKYHQIKVLRYLINERFDLIYSNTIDAHDILILLKEKIKSPVISHVHENEFSTRYNFPQSLTPEIIQTIDHFIAVSESTKSNLIENFNIPSDKISLHYEFVPIKKLRSPSINKALVKSELNIKDEFIVGASGFTDWRKGVDLFMNLAIKIRKLKPDLRIKFFWIGDNHTISARFEYEQKYIPSLKDVVFTGSKADPENYFQIFDVFVLTSREDPFPLVCLEAAALGKPIICFENSGGIPELIATQGGFIVPFADVDAMALKIIELQANTELLSQKSNEIKDLIFNYDVEIVAPQILKQMEAVMRIKNE
jgi:glycosyltransferase involved in cell wall biosynthesis